MERRIKKLEQLEGSNELKILSVEEINDNLYRQTKGWNETKVTTDYTRAELDEYQEKGYQIIIMQWVGVDDIK